MIELNLLPDVKLEFIKAQRSRRMIISTCVTVTVVAIVILGTLLGIGGLQKKHLADLSKDITSQTNSLKSTPNIDRILTVQNQLGSLTTLHAGKPATPRLLDYLNQVTPAKVNLSNFTTDFTAQTATLSGDTDSIASVNTYVDTLKRTTYFIDDPKTSLPVFSDVVLGSFGTNPDSPDKARDTSYVITLTYDKLIFDITKKVTLLVPKETTTRLQDDTKGELFQAATATTPTTKKATN